MLEHEQIDEIIRSNPKVDPSAVERTREAARRLAEAGIQIDGYRLQPPLGGTLLLSHAKARSDRLSK